MSSATGNHSALPTGSRVESYEIAGILGRSHHAQQGIIQSVLIQADQSAKGGRITSQGRRNEWGVVAQTVLAGLDGAKGAKVPR